MDRIVAPTFSIITPIYNVEPYLAEAIETLRRLATCTS